MEKTKTKLQNGWALSNGKLTILVPDQDPDEIKSLTDSIIDEIRSGEIRSKLTEDQLVSEVQRLVRLIDRITGSYPDELDIFEYLPLTKTGGFPGNKNILIANSKCSTAALYDGADGSYPERQTVQLRLMPYWASDDDFIHDRQQKDTRILELKWFDSLKKTQPVFDENGVPSKPEAVKAKYLDDSEIEPGHVYEEKSGTQYLALDGIRFTAEYDFNDGADPDYTPEQVQGYMCHAYLRWTRKLQDAMGGADDFNTLMHVMAKDDTQAPWTYTGRISTRQNPRKFTKHVGQALDLSKTRSEKFSKKATPSPNPDDTQNHTVFKYYVEPGSNRAGQKQEPQLPTNLETHARNFQAILDEATIKRPDETGWTLFPTPEIRAALGTRLDDGTAEIEYRNVRLTPDGTPYGLGKIINRKTGSATQFAIFFDMRLYTLSAHITKNPDKWLDKNKTGDSCETAGGKADAMRAYAEFLKARKTACENRTNPPLYAERLIELTLSANGLARTHTAKMAIWNEIKAQMPLTSMAAINWFAFENAMLFKDNAFSDTETVAYRRCMTAGWLQTGGTALPETCLDPDNFSDPSFPWPKEDPDPNMTTETEVS